MADGAGTPSDRAETAMSQSQPANINPGLRPAGRIALMHTDVPAERGFIEWCAIIEETTQTLGRVCPT